MLWNSQVPTYGSFLGSPAGANSIFGNRMAQTGSPMSMIGQAQGLPQQPSGQIGNAQIFGNFGDQPNMPQITGLPQQPPFNFGFGSQVPTYPGYSLPTMGNTRNPFQYGNQPINPVGDVLGNPQPVQNQAQQQGVSPFDYAKLNQHLAMTDSGYNSPMQLMAMHQRMGDDAFFNKWSSSGLIPRDLSQYKIGG